MYAAQEMFKTANKVTRPEKALILGFMAGSRGTDTNTPKVVLNTEIQNFHCFWAGCFCHISCGGKLVFVSSTIHISVAIVVLF